MITVCSVYTEYFQNPREIHELYRSEDISESNELLQRNSAYDDCRQQDLQNSSQDEFETKSVEAFCNFVEYVLKPEGRRNIV